MVKYPQVKVKLVGEDGNAFFIMGRAAGAARKAGLSKEVIAQYRAEAMSGDYDNLLVVTMEWFDCDGDEGTEVDHDFSGFVLEEDKDEYR